jgi:hypothetical protein
MKLKLTDDSRARIDIVLDKTYCPFESCIDCPLDAFDNEKSSCYEMAKSLLELLESQK